MTQKIYTVQHFLVSFVILYAYILMIYLTMLIINYLCNKEGVSVFFCWWQPYIT
jgi:hypothetical protein